MLHLNSPSTLFQSKKVYHVSDHTGTGKEAKEIIVVFRSATENLPGPLHQMLEKLLAACKFDPANTAYINVETEDDISMGVIQERYTARVVLLFGETALERNLMKLKKNIPFVINGIKILQADSLANLNGNDKEKKALWGGLQKMMTL